MSNLVNVRDHITQVVDSDWTPAFRAAIEQAVATGRHGVLVPADESAYTVRKPQVQAPSIDIRGRSRSGFTLVGEGDSSRIRLLGSGRHGSWNMIAVGGDCTDVTIRGLYLDGDRSHLVDLDPGQHTHTIQIGGTTTGGFARRVRVIDCTMTDMDGDGVALVALAGAFGAGAEVSVVDIVGCRFLGCHRSGVSNQRSAEFVKIHGCHFEGTRGQAIDFEPTGAELGTGPRRYSIMGNTFVHTSGAAVVTLSGASGGIPARDNIFAFNHVYGGRIGMVDTENVLIIGNYVESGLGHGEAVLQLRGRSEGARISQNHVVRVRGAVAGKTLAVLSRAVDLSLKGFDPVTGSVTLRSHHRETGDGPVTLTTSGTLPTGLAPATDYWLIRTDDDTVRLAASPADANSGVSVAFSDIGAGSHTVQFPTAGVKVRGFDHLAHTLTVPSHARDSGAGPIMLVTTGTLPTGLTAAADYWLIRMDADTIQLAATEADAHAGVAVVFSDAGVGFATMRLVDHPRGVDVTDNRLDIHTASDDDRCAVLFTNGRDCRFAGNEVSSYTGEIVPSGVAFRTTKTMRRPVQGWRITDNRIRGDAGGGEFTDGVNVRPVGVAVGDVAVNGNVFHGCANRIRFSRGEAGSYSDIPMAQGNAGPGIDFADLGNAPAVCIGGNPGSQGDFVYDDNDSAGQPPFVAPNGSTARRRSGGGVGSTIYFRESGTWVGK